jgi:hypothetical protein
MENRRLASLVVFASALFWGQSGIVPALAAQTIAIPPGDGKPVMTDGVFHPQEWADAASLALGETVEFFYKEHGDHVFFGAHCGDLGKPFTVDLYLAGSDGRIHQLHASAQLGERVLVPNAEDPAWVWGYSPGWYANEVRWDQPKAQSLMDEGQTRTEAQREALFQYDGFEFQIRRDKFPGNEWLLRVEIRSYPDYDSSLVHPDGTSRTSTEGWLRLAFPVGS